MTASATKPAQPYSPEQKKLVKRLQRVALQMVTTNERLEALKESRRQLLVEAYGTGIDTVQLGHIIGMSTETVRKNLETELGSLRYPEKPTPEGVTA